MMCGALLDWRMMLIERRTRKQLMGTWTGDKESFYNLFFQTMANGHRFSANYASWWYSTRYMPLMVSVIRKYYKPAYWLIPYIEDCKKQDIRLVVLSDYGHTHEKLRALNLNDDLFDWVVSAPELGGLKPASQLIEKVLENMDVTPAECLIIGDREDTDGALAQAVGADFKLVSNP
jgi:HAD superfamily hydrolase (TIGR01549 family)